MKKLFPIFLFLLTNFFFIHPLEAVGNISGVVTSQATGNPISGATVVLIRGSQHIEATTTTLANGSYSFLNINPGQYTVRVSATGFQITSLGVRVINNQTAILNFSLLMGVGTVSGQIRDANTLLPIASATVQVFQNGILTATTTTNGSGNYIVSNVSPGSYIVIASATNYQTASQGVTVQINQVSTANFFLQPDPGAISGMVRDANTLQPIPNAIVNVTQNNIVIYSTLTDLAGNYILTGVTPGSYQMNVQASNYQTGMQGVTAQANLTTIANFFLQPNPGMISGTVRDSNTMQPIVGATVQLLLNNLIISSVLTDVSGNYIFTDLAPESYEVRASADHYQTGIQGALVQTSQITTVNFFLHPNPGSISGIVIDANTLQPIVGASVRVLLNNISVGVTLTDMSGNYTFTGLAPNSYEVRASADNYQTGIQGVIVLSNQTTTADFSLQPDPGTIMGTLVDANILQPIAGATVRVLLNNISIGVTLTDISGNYTISGLAPNSYEVRASADNYQTAIQGAIVQANQTAITDFFLQPNPGTISGTVIDTNTLQPIVGVTVRILLNNISIGVTLTDMSGNYIFTGLAPNSYEVRASADNYQTDIQGAIVLANQTTTANFSLQPDSGTISGTVLDANTLEPIVGATVRVLLNNISIGVTLTDMSGNYIFTGLAPNSYEVRASADNYQTEVQGALVQTNQTTISNFFLQSDPGIIVGTVIDANTLQPISAAIVAVDFSNIVLFSTVTDSSGNYMITGVAPGSYEIRVQADNYQTAIQGVIVEANQTTIADFSLQPNPGTISGTVTDENTLQPIIGATVRVLLNNISITTTLTDMSGNYIFTGLAPNSYEVRASADNYQTGIQGTLVQANQTTIANFSLQPNPGTISGTVIDANTLQPIVGATVRVLLNNISIGVTLTDMSGNYIFTGLAPNSYEVRASADNYQTGIQGALVQTNQITIANFSLQSNPGSISGTVIDANTLQPIASATVRVLLNNISIGVTLTDMSGNYILTGLAPNSYEVRASADNYQTKIQGALVQASQTTIVNFSLQSNPGTISGTVIDANTLQPIASATVRVLLNNISIGVTLTDMSGNYIFTGLAPNSYEVRASADNYQTGIQGALVQASQTTIVNFSLQSNPGTISGTVIDANTLQPIASATVRVLLNNISIGVTLTDLSGNYIFTGLAPGSYEVRASADNYQTKIQGALVQASQTTIVNFSLQSNPGTISGAVIDANTLQPIVGATVRVLLNNISIGVTLTDMSGNYIFTGLAPGSYEVHAHAPGYQIGMALATVQENLTTIVDFSLQSNPGIVQGVITNGLTGNPIPGAIVQVFQNSSLVGTTVSDNNGMYIIDFLPSGNYTLTASAAGFFSNSTNFSIANGQTITVNLALSPNLPPRNLTGEVIVNRFLLQEDRINHIQWKPSLNPTVVEYLVYRNGFLVARISASDPLMYNDHNRKKNVTDIYSVSAVSANGDESSFVSISLR